MSESGKTENPQEITERRGTRRLLIDAKVAARIDWIRMLDDQMRKGLISEKERNEKIARTFVAQELMRERAVKEASLAREIAQTDQLTGVYTRRAFEEKCNFLIRQGRKVGALMLDIDHFKNINDTYGHPTGDEVLALTALVASSELRQIRPDEESNDIMARYGGEEFIMLLQGVDSVEEMEKIGERIRNAISQSEFIVGSKKIPVTVSIGGCVYSGETKKNFINKVDQSLYAAKNNGRNQTVIGK